MAEWHDGYAKAMEHTHDMLDQLGVPREANGAKLYVHERIRALAKIAPHTDTIMAAEYRAWIDFFHAGSRDYNDFLRGRPAGVKENDRG